MESKTRILVVDDIESIRALFAEILRREGYEVKEACNGKDGLQMARQWQPDLMLLDVMLPDCNGMELCRQIKSDPGLPTTFVILCSGEATSGSDKIQGADTGADDYLVKPVSYSELIARVRTMVRLQHANVALRASEQHWRRLVEILPDAVMMLSSGGHLLSANPKGAALLGYQSPEELPGKNMFELVEPA